MSDLSVIAKKKFGQNFLVDKAIKSRVSTNMLNFLNQFPGRYILEIGPGRGDLTEFFVDWGREVVALEIDPEAIEYNKAKFENTTNFTLCHTDALDLFQNYDKNLNLISPNFALLSSLPYNVGSRILMDIPIIYFDTPLAVILQKEVSQKAVSREYFSFFGAWLNLFWSLKNALSIAPHCFQPQPKVYSSLMLGNPKYIIKTDLPEFLNTAKKRLYARNTLKKLFSNPSRTLANNLKYLSWTKDDIKKFYADFTLPYDTRLDWENYESILQNVLNFKDLNLKA